MISIQHVLVQSNLSQEEKNVFYFDILKQIGQTIHLENCFLMGTKDLHSMRMCLTVHGDWHVEHCGCSCFSMKERVRLVWPIRNRDFMTCSLLDFLKAPLYSPKVGWIWKSLLWMLLFQRCCNFVWRSLLILGLESCNFRGSDLRPIWLLSLLFHFLSLQCDLESSI